MLSTFPGLQAVQIHDLPSMCQYSVQGNAQVFVPLKNISFPVCAVHFSTYM
jgi:hypothetical protein